VSTKKGVSSFISAFEKEHEEKAKQRDIWGEV